MTLRRIRLVALHAAAILMAGLSLAGMSTTSAGAHSLDDVEAMLRAKEPDVQFVDQPAPEFILSDAEGRSVALKDFRGKVVILYFIDASGLDVRHSEKLARVQAQINQTPMHDIVQFIAITTDPEGDASSARKQYGRAHGFDPFNWMLLTSGTEEPEATQRLAESYGLTFAQQGSGHQLHDAVTHLIDKSGRLRARFHGLKFQDINLIIYTNALTNDTH